MTNINKAVERLRAFSVLLGQDESWQMEEGAGSKYAARDEYRENLHSHARQSHEDIRSVLDLLTSTQQELEKRNEAFRIVSLNYKKALAERDAFAAQADINKLEVELKADAIETFVSQRDALSRKLEVSERENAEWRKGVTPAMTSAMSFRQTTEQ
jgi:hypothetical protein